MKDHEDGRPASGITVGDVHGTGIVIGHKSTASVKLRQTSTQLDAVALLDEFIRLLARHQSSVADAAGIRESATAARAELEERSPRWRIVRGLLRGIAAGVAGVSALAEAINNVQALVAHLPT
jgi:hypothetical protein